MNSSRLTQLRAKQANRYIGRPQPVDSSLQTWRVQARGSSGPVVPATVPTKGSNEGTGVMEFANSKSNLAEARCTDTGVVQFNAGRGTHGEYLNVLMKAASCAVCADPNYATNPGGVTLPCCTYEPRQRYPITNAQGVIVDMNTFIPANPYQVAQNPTGIRCVDCQGQQYNDQGKPINCSCGRIAVYGGGGVPTTTVNPTGMRLKFPSG